MVGMVKYERGEGGKSGQLAVDVVCKAFKKMQHLAKINYEFAVKLNFLCM